MGELENKITEELIAGRNPIHTMPEIFEGVVGKCTKCYCGGLNPQWCDSVRCYCHKPQNRTQKNPTPLHKK